MYGMIQEGLRQLPHPPVEPINYPILQDPSFLWILVSLSYAWLHQKMNLMTLLATTTNPFGIYLLKVKNRDTRSKW